jgi:GNAT superfamily N-acetyltransferase
MEIRIRRAGVEDLEHVLQHRRAMFEEMGHADASALEWMEEASRAYFEAAVRSGTYCAWMAEDGERQVVGGGGVLIAEWPGFPGEKLAKRAWILNMYTQPRPRRCGVAKRLMETMLEWCRLEGFGTVWLHASDAGRRVYEELGFQASNEMKLKL